MNLNRSSKEPSAAKKNDNYKKNIKKKPHYK